MGPKPKLKREEVEVLRKRDDGSFDVVEARRRYDEKGFVVLQLLTDAECDAGIYELYNRVLMTQPWNDPAYADTGTRKIAPLVLRDNRGPIEGEETPEHQKRVVSVLKSDNIARKVLEEYNAHWPLHKAFGAPCDDIGFHLPLVWRVRQDPHVHKIVAALSGTEELWVDINRPIMKLPGQGEQEFLHWDLDVFTNPFVSRSPNVQGKVVYTPSRLVAVTGTHTPAFRETFVARYKGLATPGKAKTGLSPDKDPEGYFEKQREYILPAGSCVFWNAQMLHGQTKTPPKENIEFGFYLGFFPAGSRPGYADALTALKRLEQKGGASIGPATELDDRLRSFKDGHAPKLWPSFDRIHFYPFRYQNYHNLVQNVIDKMPRRHPSISRRTSTAKGTKGTVYPHLLPWRPDRYYSPYVPPSLTSLGKRLLGMEVWQMPLSRTAPASASASASILYSTPTTTLMGIPCMK